MKAQKILLVEDNPTTREILRVTLESWGYTALGAPDGRTALELMKDHTPDLVLQDLLLPDMDGFELVSRLRALPGGSEVPILACSGLLSKLEEARSLQVGFSGFLFKPVEPSRLLQTIQAYLAPISASPEMAGQGRRVLLAEDDPIQRKLLGVHLSQLGFQVVTAEDGLEALKQARRSPPDAIVSDVLMPGLDGFKLCLAVRQDPRLEKVAVILTSAVYLEEADRRLGRQVGANAFVTRTPDLKELKETVLRNVGKETPKPSVPTEVLTEEHSHRVIRQLERQAAMNAGLARRCSLQAAQISILAGVSEVLTRTQDSEKVLDEILARYLDAAGTPTGAAYLVEPDGRLSLRAQIGYSDSSQEMLWHFFGHADLLHRAMKEGELLEVPSSRVAGDQADDLLKKAGVKSILITPLVLGEERLGALIMASGNRVLEEDWIAFGKAVGFQIAQAIALARTLSRLSSANRIKTEFLNTMSHELRTPLQVISSNVALFLDGHYGRLDALQRKKIELVSRQCRDLVEMIEGMLDLSRIEAGQVSFRVREFTVGDLFKELQISHEETPKKPVAIEWQGEKEVPPLIGDWNKVKGILYNLIDNALKFTIKGKVTVTARYLSQSDRVEFQVRDTGIGMPPERLPDIFDPFRQLDASDTREFGGVGLGLTIVKRLVDILQGRIEVESKVGEGSTFTVNLPRAYHGPKL